MSQFLTMAQAANPLFVILMIAGGILLFALMIFFFSYGFLYLRALLAGAHVGVFEIISMRLMGVSPSTIVDSRITAIKAGLPLETRHLQAHYLAGGDVPNVTRALVAASKAGIPLTFDMACAIDLAGRDVLQAVGMYVKPAVIDCPDPSKGRNTVAAVAKDGIQVQAKARVTVRANVEKLVGGAWMETIIARVGEGIVTTIGSSETYKAVLENPDLISKRVLDKALDAETAFEIVSIDIADVDVGENIGAKLQADQAEADKRVAQALAERRRAMAVAREQEMNALVSENRAKVVLAEAEVPKAIAQAFRDGNLGIMDYYKFKNIEADTDMRNSIGGQAEQTSDDAQREQNEE
ncbi:MAG: flotillin-like protein FloA [Planctomycetota bacterium]